METPRPPEPAAPTAEASAFLEAKAFASRCVLVFGSIDHALAAETVRRLVALDAASHAPIELLVSSPGGHVESGDAIHDAIRYIEAPVHIVGMGWVGSAAVHLYLAAPRERRLCTPNTRFLIHQPSGGAGGSASDIAIQARELLKARERIASVIARETGQPLERVQADIERDRWMSAEEAVDYGLVARVVERRAALD